MTNKFEIAGRPVGQTSPSDAAMERFISGDEPMTTVTVQIPTRLKRALKREAAEQDRTIKEILIDLLEVHFAANKQ